MATRQFKIRYVAPLIFFLDSTALGLAMNEHLRFLNWEFPDQTSANHSSDSHFLSDKEFLEQPMLSIRHWLITSPLKPVETLRAY